MRVTIRSMNASDVPEVVRGWGRSFPLTQYQVDEARFRRVILEDPNHGKEASLVAICDGKIVGFISSVVREGVLGADNRGRPGERDNGYLKVIFVLEEYRRQGIGTKLLDKAIEYIRSKGKKVVRVVAYTGAYFFPGVNLEYEAAVKFFEVRGFQRDYVIDDMDLDLRGFHISDYQKDARRRMAEFGVHIEDYNPAMLGKMRIFVENLNMTAWFPEGWEEGFRKKGNKVVALKGQDIVGWASYWPGDETAGFGPIAVLKEMRGNGIGSCLLLESVLRIKDAGAKRVTAGWTNTPFYVPNGWKICRQYVVFEKEL